MKKAFLLCFSLLLLGFATAVPTAAGSCCPDFCSTVSSCDAICGVGLGRCVGGTTCCRMCVCSLGGS